MTKQQKLGIAVGLLIIGGAMVFTFEDNVLLRSLGIALALGAPWVSRQKSR